MKHPDFRKYPSVFTILPFSAGIIFSYYLDLHLHVLQTAAFAALIGIPALAAIMIYKKVIDLLSLKYALFFAAVFLCGVSSMQYSYYKKSANDISTSIDVFKNNNVILYGSPADEPDVTEDRIRLMLNVDSVSQVDKVYPFKGTVLVSLYKTNFAKEVAPVISINDRIEVNVKLEKLPHRRNPGEFDYGEYLKLHGISAVASSSGYDKLKIDGNISAGFYKEYVLVPVKAFINKVIDDNSVGDQREFLRGLLLGDKSNLSRETKDNFINAGVAHIIAVSGLNVAYVLIILNALLLVFPIPRVYKNAAVIICLLFYMNLTGNSPSIVRATIMAIVFLLAQLLERKPNSYNTIALAALVIVAIDPRQLFDSGFILSFSAILSLVYFTPLLVDLANRISWYKNLNLENKLVKYFKDGIMLLIGTLAAQIGTLPITAIMFNKISIVSLAVNLFAIPISNISLALGFVSVFASLISPWIASVFSAANNFIMYYLLQSIAFSARLDFSYIETYGMDAVLLLLYYALIFMLFKISRANYAGRLVIAVLLAANFFVFRSVLNTTNDVRLAYLDVGNSNCTLISMPGGTNILVNSGTSSPKYSSADRNVLPYLKREGVKKIDILLITAMDANELRNIKHLSERIEIKKIMIPVYFKSLFKDKLIGASFANQHIQFIDSSIIVNQKGKFRLYLYYDKVLQGSSMMASFVYGSKSFLFSDAEEASDIEMNSVFLDAGTKYTALRVPQYGSFEFTSPRTIVQTDPSLIIISSQKNNRKSVDADVFRETLSKAGYRVLSVGESGAIILETDGERTKLKDWK